MRRKLNIERLDARIVLNATWHNAALPCDVDRSGLVTSDDIELIVEAFDEGGFRLIDPSQSNVLYAVDVSQDGLLSPLDVLRVVNVLNAFSEPLSLTTNRPDADLDGDGIVLSSQVTVRGTSLPGATISAIIGDANVITVDADAQGDYHLTLDVASGKHEISLMAADPRGRSLTTPIIIRRGDAIHSWNASVLQVVRNWGEFSAELTEEGMGARSSPPQVARGLAMIHTAMFDAINQFDLNFESYLPELTAPPQGASPEAAAAGAAYAIAKHLYPGAAALTMWDATLAENLANIADATSRDLGFSYGLHVGDRMIVARANDGSAATSEYTSGTAPGNWQPTLPAFQAPLLPQWPDVEPFVVVAVESFRPEAPPDLTSAAYANAVDQVMQLGAMNSSTRTADQSAIAEFWADGAGTATPPGHWNRIATDVTLPQTRSLVENARLFALLNLALADAGIAAWDAKYEFDFWRPIDAIRQASVDGNPETVADEQWLPLLITPPFPTYTSGHSTFSGAGAKVLTLLLGDTVAFATSSDPKDAATHEPIPEQQMRSYVTFQHAAEEAGLSRIYGGIHFNFDNTAGLLSGRSIGEAVVQTALRQRS